MKTFEEILASMPEAFNVTFLKNKLKDHGVEHPSSLNVYLEDHGYVRNHNRWSIRSNRTFNPGK